MAVDFYRDLPVRKNLFLKQRGFVFLEIFLQPFFGDERNGSALGIFFKMFVMHQRFADQADVKIGIFERPDLAGL